MTNPIVKPITLYVSVVGKLSAGLTIVANATGPAILGTGRSFVLNLFFVICTCGYLNLSKLSERRPYILHMLYKNFVHWKQIKFFILSGNSLLRESQFHIANCLKSFDFKLFFVYTVVEGPFFARWHTLFALFCQTYGLLQNPFNPAIAIILAQGLQRYNSPADWARKLFKPSTDSEVC